MKKLTAIILVISLLASCTKEIKNSNTKLAEQEFLKQTKEISKKYKKTSASRLSDWQKLVIMADINGALAGMQAGAYFGPGPHVIGAAAFGAGFFSLMIMMPYYDYDACGNYYCANCTNPSYSFSANTLNPIGEFHNQLIVSALDSINYLGGSDPCLLNTLNTVDFFGRETSRLTGVSEDSIYMIRSKASVVADFESYNSAIGSLTGMDAINASRDFIEEAGWASEFVCDFYTDYFETIYTLDEYADVYNYTTEIEELVLNNSSISVNDKNTLLVLLSVSRHSSGIWINSGLL